MTNTMGNEDRGLPQAYRNVGTYKNAHMYRHKRVCATALKVYAAEQRKSFHNTENGKQVVNSDLHHYIHTLFTKLN